MKPRRRGPGSKFSCRLHAQAGVAELKPHKRLRVRHQIQRLHAQAGVAELKPHPVTAGIQTPPASPRASRRGRIEAVMPSIALVITSRLHAQAGVAELKRECTHRLHSKRDTSPRASRRGRIEAGFLFSCSKINARLHAQAGVAELKPKSHAVNFSPSVAVSTCKQAWPN